MAPSGNRETETEKERKREREREAKRKERKEKRGDNVAGGEFALLFGRFCLAPRGRSRGPDNENRDARASNTRAKSAAEMPPNACVRFVIHYARGLAIRWRGRRVATRVCDFRRFSERWQA